MRRSGRMDIHNAFTHMLSMISQIKIMCHPGNWCFFWWINTCQNKSKQVWKEVKKSPKIRQEKNQYMYIYIYKPIKKIIYQRNTSKHISKNLSKEISKKHIKNISKLLSLDSNLCRWDVDLYHLDEGLKIANTSPNPRSAQKIRHQNFRFFLPNVHLQ